MKRPLPIPIGVRKKFLKHLAKWAFPNSMYEGRCPAASNLDNSIVGCKPICLSGEVPPRYERTKEGLYAGVDRAGTACGVTDAETIVKSRTSGQQRFANLCGLVVRCRAWEALPHFPMMHCISAAHHFYGEPNLKIADFQISSRDWGAKSPASSPSVKITKVSFEATRANLALTILSPLKHHDRT